MPPEERSDLVPADGGNPDTSSVLAETYRALTEGLTGVASSERKELILSLGHILQKLRGRKFLRVLLEEWNGYREKGRIAEDYVQSEQHQECLQEILDFLDEDAPDEQRFNVLKRILIAAACEQTSSRESVLPQQYMRLVRGLSSGEALVLFAAYSIAKAGDWERPQHGGGSATEWVSRIAEESGLRFAELVANHEDALIEKRLITNRRLGDRSGVRLGDRYRLTDLGWDLCRFVDEQEIEAPAA